MCSVVKCVCVCPSASSSAFSPFDLSICRRWTDLVSETIDRLGPFPPPPPDSSDREGDVAVILLDVALQDVGAGAENTLKSVEVDKSAHET